MIPSVILFQDPFWASNLAKLETLLSDLEGDFSFAQKTLIQNSIRQIAITVKKMKEPLALIHHCQQLEERLSPLRTHLNEATGHKRLRSVSNLSFCIDTTVHELWRKVHQVADRTLSTALELIPKRDQSIKNKAFLLEAIIPMTYKERKAFFTDLEKLPSDQRVSFLSSWLSYLEMETEMSQTDKKTLLLREVNLGNTGLHRASTSGKSSLIKKLLKRPNTQNHAGNTPLHHAIFSGDAESAAALIAHRGVDVNTKNLIGQTPLHWAVLFNKIDVVTKLLEHRRIDLNLRDHDGETPLFYTTSPKFAPLLLPLISRGADSRLRDHDGDSFYARQKMMGITPPSFIHPDELGYKLKMASLIWGLNGSIKLPDGAFFTFSAGGNISIPLSLMISNLPSLPYRVKKAFSSITLDRSPDEILSSISRGKVTIIPIGYDGHAMALVLYKDLLFICDRGTDGETESLRSFRINQKNITIFTLEMLQNIKEAPEAEALKYYYERLPTSLSYGDKLEEITPVFLRLDSKMQKTSNCSAASLKLAIRASLAALAYYENGNTLPDPISAEIYKQSKAATRELRKISYNELKEATEKLTHLQRKEILDLFSEKREKLGIKA